MRLASLSARLHDVLGRLSARAEDDELRLGRSLALSLMIGIVAGLGAVLLQWGIDSVNRLTLVGLAGALRAGDR